MRKNVFGRKLKRNINERKALFKSLMSSLVLNEKIKTTEAKAKAIKGDVDKLITKARKEGNLARKLLSSHLTPKAIDKLISQIVPRFKKRQGGYTRIIKIGQRLSDSASIVLMEWVEKKEEIISEEKPEITKKEIKKENKKIKKLESSKKEKKIKKSKK